MTDWFQGRTYDTTTTKISNTGRGTGLYHRGSQRAVYCPPSLSGAIKDVEKEAGITIFSRCRAGVALTKEGMEFLGYARQVVQQMELLESRYIWDLPLFMLEKQSAYLCCVTNRYATKMGKQL